MLFFSSGDLKRGALTWFPLCSTQYTSDARRRTHVRPHSLSEQHLSEVGDIKKFKRTVNTWGHKQMAHAPPWYRGPPPPPRVHRNARSHLSGSKLEEKSENMFLWSFSETLKSKNRCIEQFRRTLWNIPAFLISFFPTHWTRLLFPIMFPLLRKHGSFHSLKEFLLLNGCHLNLCFITLTGSCP